MSTAEQSRDCLRSNLNQLEAKISVLVVQMNSTCYMSCYQMFERCLLITYIIIRKVNNCHYTIHLGFSTL